MQAKKLDNVKALILGQFAKVKDQEFVADVQHRFTQKFQDYVNLKNDTPIFKIDNIGHLDTNVPILFLAETEISADKNGVYKMEISLI